MADTLLKINGVYVKTPKSMSATISDFDGKTTRTANGSLTRDRIAVKRKVECSWGPLTQSEISTLLSAVTDVFFTVTYLDPKDGTKTITAYVGDRTAPLYNANMGLWESLSMNFIEK